MRWVIAYNGLGMACNFTIIEKRNKMDEEKLEQVRELLRISTENVSVNHWIPAIHEDKHDALAQEIVKLFAIPVVRLSCFKEILDMYNAIGDDSDFYKWLYDKVHEA